MNSMLNHGCTLQSMRRSFPSPRRLVKSTLVAGLLLLGASWNQAQILVSDDFSDGNDTDNPTWTRLSGYAGSSGQAWLVGGGTNIPNAYRLLAPNNGINGVGFVGSYTGPSIADGRVEVDFIQFGGPGANPVFGVAGRLNGDNGVGALTGYSYAYEPFAAGLAGELVLYRINPGISITDLGSEQISLDPTKDYRFVLEFSGSTISGRVFEIGGGLVAERTVTDSTYASGFSGVLGYSQTGVAPTDFTADNFLVVVPEPGFGVLVVLGAMGLLAGRRLWQTRA